MSGYTPNPNDYVGEVQSDRNAIFSKVSPANGADQGSAPLKYPLHSSPHC